MTSQEINVEMQVENIPETPTTTPQIVKEYHYTNKNGKDVKVVRKYNVKYSQSSKNLVNKARSYHNDMCNVEDFLIKVIETMDNQ